MKNYASNRFYTLLSGFILIVSFLVSCSKDDDTMVDYQSYQVKNGMLIAESLNAISKLEEKNTAYSMLSSTDKYDYWHTRLIFESENDRYNEHQKTKILEVINALEPDFFTSQDKKAIFKTVFLPKWLSESAGIFTPDETFLLLSSLDQSFKISNNLSSNGGGVINLVEETPKACICALNSSYTCPYIHSLSGFPMIYFGECLSSRKCAKGTTGCGALADDACDGDICVQNVYP